LNISIIIVNYNSGNVIKDCINSIYKYEDEKSFEIIIVDQNSTDNSGEIIKNFQEKYNNIKYIFNNTIKSFSFANNQGYEISDGYYILIMNPDVLFKSSILNKLITELEKNDSLGAICPQLIGEDGNFQSNYFQRYQTLMQFILFYSVISKLFLKSENLRNKYLEDRNINLNSGKTEFVKQIPCAFFLLKRKIFEEIEKMDEHYVLFFEDVDLSYQINKKYKLAIDTSCKVIHLGGITIRNENDWWVYGRFITSMHYFFRKNYGRCSAFILKLIAIENSIPILFFEYLIVFFGKKDLYKLKKHKNFLKLIFHN